MENCVAYLLIWCIYVLVVVHSAKNKKRAHSHKHTQSIDFVCLFSAFGSFIGLAKIKLFLFFPLFVYNWCKSNLQTSNANFMAQTNCEIRFAATVAAANVCVKQKACARIRKKIENYLQYLFHIKI